MAKKVNNPGMIPIFPEATPPVKPNKTLGATIQRPSFITAKPLLSTPPAKFKAYFASGQAPDGMTDMRRGYQIPLDWNKASTQLRMPQMVWLSLVGIDIGIQYIKSYPTNATVYEVFWPALKGPIATGGTSYDQFQNSLGGTNTYIQPPGAATDEYNVVTGNYFEDVEAVLSAPNYFNMENTRLQPICAAVKNKIEKLRPGRTWVDFIDYNNFNAFPNTTINPDGNWEKYPTFSTGAMWSYMITPDPTEKFLGTNFLNINIGGQGSGPGGDSTNTTGFFILDEAPDSGYGYSKNRLKLNVPKFAKYRVMLFSVGGEGQQNPIEGDDPAIPIPGPIGVGTTMGDSLAGYLLMDNSGRYAVTNAARESQVAHYNETITGWGPKLKAFYMLVADDLKDYGFTYEGDSSNIDEDLLVNLIAKNFNFNPSNGKDL
jgi:hypothetical protein